MPTKTKCWDRTNASGGHYTVCDKSKGQKGVYKDKKKKKEPETAKEYKDKLGKKIKDFTPEEKKKYNAMTKRESRARKKK